jgi:hypothetical protein
MSKEQTCPLDATRSSRFDGRASNRLRHEYTVEIRFVYLGRTIAIPWSLRHPRAMNQLNIGCSNPKRECLRWFSNWFGIPLRHSQSI